MLRYAKGSCPPVLTSWQATPNAGWDSLPAEAKGEVRDALLRDQGHLCAYCQRRIPAKDEPMKVEHAQPQSTGEGMLRWSNLLGVCLGGEGRPRDERHCDTAKGDVVLFLHPVDGQGPSPREHLRYSSEGEARARDSAHRDAVQADIKALNLNAARLKRARKEVVDALRERLKRANFSRKALQDELRAAQIQSAVPAVPQCEVVRYHVLRWARQQGLVL